MPSKVYSINFLRPLWGTLIDARWILLFLAKNNYVKTFHIPLFKILQIVEYHLNKTTDLKMRSTALNIFFHAFIQCSAHPCSQIHVFMFPSFCKRLPYLAFLLNIQRKASCVYVLVLWNLFAYFHFCSMLTFLLKNIFKYIFIWK